MLALLLVAAALATPFEDVEGRFHLILPPQWRFAPQPGDLGGAVFRRQLDGVYANAMVRVMTLPPDAELPAFAARVRAASEGEPGYRCMAQRPCTVAGVPAECRRYLSLINGNPKLSKIAEQRILIANGTGFVVHAESLADGFPLFEPDILALLASFAVGPGVEERRPAAHEGATWHDLLGSWASGGGHTLLLSPAGTIILDGRHGTYEVQVGNLICKLEDGMAVFSLDIAGGKLTLSGGMFGDGEQFLRAAGAASKAKTKAPAGMKKRRKDKV